MDAYRRNRRRAYVDLMGRKLADVRTASGSGPGAAAGPNAPAVVPGEVRALVRGELTDPDRSIRAALSRTRDRTTRVHLEDFRVQIDRALNPEG